VIVKKGETCGRKRRRSWKGREARNLEVKKEINMKMKRISINKKRKKMEDMKE
jgi:hypothetical protein